MFLYEVEVLVGGFLVVLGLDVVFLILLFSYDFDIGLVFLIGKGDICVFLYELFFEFFFFLECNSFMLFDFYKGFVFLFKIECDVWEVELMWCLWLC